MKKKFLILLFLVFSVKFFCFYFSGYIYHEDTGLPIYNAEVIVGNEHPYPLGIVYIDTTDINGSYEEFI